MSESGWIAVDLDGTLAEYHGWQGVDHVGAPIKLMVDRVKRWIAEGRDVRIFTARVCRTGDEGHQAREAIDDRAIQVLSNHGYRVDGKEDCGRG